jgi:hypothetical protein
MVFACPSFKGSPGTAARAAVATPTTSASTKANPNNIAAVLPTHATLAPTLLSMAELTSSCARSNEGSIGCEAEERIAQMY